MRILNDYLVQQIYIFKFEIKTKVEKNREICETKNKKKKSLNGAKSISIGIHVIGGKRQYQK